MKRGPGMSGLCEWRSNACDEPAAYVRHTNSANSGIPYALCDEHGRSLATAGCSFSPLILPIVRVLPGSDLHCALDAAFDTLVNGLYTPAELRAQQIEAKARRKVAA